MRSTLARLLFALLAAFVLNAAPAAAVETGVNETLNQTHSTADDGFRPRRRLGAALGIVGVRRSRHPARGRPT